MFQFRKNNAGFTLVETLLSVAILVLMVGMASPVVERLFFKNDFNTTANIYLSSLNKARSYSISNKLDSKWGTYIGGGSITLFKGDSYVLRDSSYDEIYQYSSNTQISGTNEFIFSKLSGTTTAGTVTISSIGDDSVNISINEEGAIFKN